MTAKNPHAKHQSRRPLISVCVPMYNNSTTIERCLRSVLEQDGDFEILVVDDGSSDDSVAIAAKMLRGGDRLIYNDSRLGANRNHNKCIELARGDYIQFVHGDDLLLPGALQTLAKCFDDPTVGLAFAPRRVLTDDQLWLKRCGTLHTRFRQLNEYNRGSALVMQMTLQGLGTNWIGEPTCVMFRRQLAVDVGACVPTLPILPTWTSGCVCCSDRRLALSQKNCRYGTTLPLPQRTSQNGPGGSIACTF